jgi:hypothetical protein
MNPVSRAALDELEGPAGTLLITQRMSFAVDGDRAQL